jgi:hypothetical protein
MEDSEALAAINAANTKLDKIKKESEASVQKAKDLQDVIDSMTAQGKTLSPELAAAITALTDKVQAVDNVVQDVPEEPAGGG